jgi:hypothetical protein
MKKWPQAVGTPRIHVGASARITLQGECIFAKVLMREMLQRTYPQIRYHKGHGHRHLCVHVVSSWRHIANGQFHRTVYFPGSHTKEGATPTLLGNDRDFFLLPGRRASSEKSMNSSMLRIGCLVQREV